MHRLTISLPIDLHARVEQLANDHRPRLSKSYVIEYAIREMLKGAQDPNFLDRLGDPTKRKDEHG